MDGRAREHIGTVVHDIIHGDVFSCVQAHALVARMTDPNITYPFMVLLVSGGHTMLVLAKVRVARCRFPPYSRS